MTAQPVDSPVMLALRSVDADLGRVDAQIAPLAAELAERKKERARLAGRKEELLDCLLGKRSFQPALVPEPAETPAPVMETGPGAIPADADGKLDGWRDCPVGDMELAPHLAQLVAKWKARTIGHLAELLRVSIPTGAVATELDALRVAVNDVAADDPDFEPLAPRTCTVCGGNADFARQEHRPAGVCSAACLKDLEATGGAQTVPPARSPIERLIDEACGVDAPAPTSPIDTTDQQPAPVTPESLGLTPAQLNGGQGYEVATRKGGEKPVKVQVLSGRSAARYVVLSASGHGTTPRRWQVVRVYPEGQFAREYPSAKTRARPAHDGAQVDRHAEVLVIDRATGGRFVVGYRHDFRVVTEAAADTTAKKRKAG